MNMKASRKSVVLSCAVCSCLLIQPTEQAAAGSFIFAQENGEDLTTHPQGYFGSSTPNPQVQVCIVPGTANASSMEISVQNAIATMNQQTVQLPNTFTGSNNSIPPNALDFESVILHEIGHCVGLGHINVGSLAGPNARYTTSTNGADNIFTFNPGPDGVVGSADDIRGDDGNLHWFVTATNDPFSPAAIIDSTTFSRNLADLPGTDNFPASANSQVGSLLGYPDSEAVMNFSIGSDEAARSFVADDVHTLKFAMTGLDRIANTNDDYTTTLIYGGISDSSDCDITISSISTAGLASCTVGGQFLGSNAIGITSAQIRYNPGFNWYFNSTPITADTSAPIASYLIPTPGQSFPVSSSLALAGTFDDTSTGGSGIASGQYVLRNLADFNWINTSGVPVAYSPLALSLSNTDLTSADWQLPVSLPIGNYRVYVRGTDTSANQASWSSQDFSVANDDMMPPLALIIDPSSGTNLMAPAVLNGIIDDAGQGDSGILNANYLLRNLSTFDWIDNSGQTIGFAPADLSLSNATATSAEWDLSITLPPDNYRLYVRGRDTAANLSAWTTADFTVTPDDIVAPLVSMTTPTEGQTAASPIVFSGVFDDTSNGNSNILSGDYLLRDLTTFNWVDASGNVIGFAPASVNLSTPSQGIGNWDFTANLNNGNYRVYVRGRDEFNNLSAWLTRNFTVSN